MKWIGLTGGIASGKSTVTTQLSQAGLPIIDTDLIVRELLESDVNVQKTIEKEFGTINRSKLREIVFSDIEKRQRLERILHPLVGEIVQDRIGVLEKEKPAKQAVIIVVPLLFEVGWQKFFDQIVAVLADTKLQMSRLTKRDKIKEDLAKKMLKSQLSNKEKEERSNYVIWNNGTLAELKKSVTEYLKKSNLI